MAAIITKDIRTHNAKQFVEAVSEQANTSIYLFIGKPDVWPVEGSPTTPIDTYRGQIDIWDNMIALKRVTNADTSTVIPKRDWSTSNVYSQYDDMINSGNLYNLPYVVLNSGYGVYKCLNNNFGQVSTVEPTGTGGSGNNLIYTNDGYIWKYMYTIDTANILKFTTNTFMPIVSNTQVVLNSSNTRGIYSVKILSAGTGYANGFVTINGDGSGATANIVVGGSGQIARVNVLTAGINYSVANIALTGGTGGVIEPIISPPMGHGSDANDELGGVYSMVNVRLEQRDTAFPASGGKFRQIGLVKDPYDFNTSNISTQSTLRAYRTFTMATISNQTEIVAGATVTGLTSGANATVVSYSGNAINYIQHRNSSANIVANFKDFSVGEALKINVSGIGTIGSKGNSSVVLNSGPVIYIDNRNVISRADDQVESLFVVLEF